MPSFDPQTPVARHASHTLCGGWKPGAGTAPVLYCRDCFLVVPDPLILAECVKKPHASVIERWLRSQYERVPEEPPTDRPTCQHCGKIAGYEAHECGGQCQWEKKP